MVDDTDYEILPHEELERLRNEVSEIKKNPLGKRYGGSDLIDSVHKLTETLNNMNHIFTSTNQELLDDFKENSMQKSFQTMTEQNEELAKGILSVAQLVQKQTELTNKFIDKLDNMFKRQEEQDKLEMEQIKKLDLPDPKPKDAPGIDNKPEGMPPMQNQPNEQSSSAPNKSNQMPAPNQSQPSMPPAPDAPKDELKLEPLDIPK